MLTFQGVHQAAMLETWSPKIRSQEEQAIFCNYFSRTPLRFKCKNSYGFGMLKIVLCPCPLVCFHNITICMVSTATSTPSIPLPFPQDLSWTSWSKDRSSPLPPWSMMLPGQKKNPVAPSRRWWGRLREPRHPPDKMTSCNPPKNERTSPEKEPCWKEMNHLATINFQKIFVSFQGVIVSAVIVIAWDADPTNMISQVTAAHSINVY